MKKYWPLITIVCILIILGALPLKRTYIERESTRRTACFLALRNDCEASLAWNFIKSPNLGGEEGVELIQKFNVSFPVREDDLIKRESVSNNESGAPTFLSATLSGAKYNNGIYIFQPGMPIQIKVVAFPADDSKISWHNTAYTTTNSQTLIKEGNDSKFNPVSIFSGEWRPDKDTGSLTIAVAREDGKRSWIIIKMKAE